MITLRSFVPVFILALCASCASDVANRYYLSERLPAKRVEDVEVLSTAPQRPYQVIADFQSRNESTGSLRRKAAEIGADAIIITRAGGSYSWSEEWAGKDAGRGTGSRVVATAIIYSGR